jgi:hypothetical protein
MSGAELQQKVRDGGTPSPAREMRALPGAETARGFY